MQMCSKFQHSWTKNGLGLVVLRLLFLGGAVMKLSPAHKILLWIPVWSWTRIISCDFGADLIINQEMRANRIFMAKRLTSPWRHSNTI